MSDSRDEKYESFLKLYRANESCISRYILALCPNYSAAEDIVQETMLVMWRKYGQYEPGTNFIAWGMQIARYCVNHYYRQERLRIVCFDNEALESISRHPGHVHLNQDAYLDALDECTGGLSEENKKMITWRYADNMKVIDIALKLEKTLSATYKVMSRLHHAILTCIEKKLAKGEIL